MKKVKSYKSFLTETYSSGDVDKVHSLVKSFLEKKTGFTFIFLGGVEEYKNSMQHGFGVRAIYDGTKSIRINWTSPSVNSSRVDSVDLWNGTSHDPSLHVKCNGKSLAQVLPALADIIKNPSTGTFVTESEESLNETHRFAVTVSDSNHTMVTKRDVKVQKFINVQDTDKESAMARAKKHYKAKGYKVHDIEYVSEGDVAMHVGSGTKASSMTYSSKKLGRAPIKSAKEVSLDSGSVKGGRVTFPKGTEFTQLPGGVFGKHPDVKETHSGFGHMIRRSPENLDALHASLKESEEAINEARSSNADELAGQLAKVLNTGKEVYARQLQNDFGTTAAPRMFQDVLRVYGHKFQNTGSDARPKWTLLKKESIGAQEILAATKKSGDTIEVVPGGKGETYEPSAEAKDLENNVERVTYEEQLKDLSGLITLVVRGASNALFLAGKGGLGKSFTVEKVLAEHGLQDGHGYYKNTGTASPVAIYQLLYDNKHNIIVFDDCDSAMQDMEARNMIKAATDTRPDRKIAYNKKSSWIIPGLDESVNEEVPPGMEDVVNALKKKYPDNDKKVYSIAWSMHNKKKLDERGEDDEVEEVGGASGMYPRSFHFFGRIIFISNLPLNKLDPDGALRTRALVINIDPTKEEILAHMEKIVDHIPIRGGNLTHEERVEVVDSLKSGGGRQEGLSIRKLVRALEIRAALGSDGNWQRISQLYG
jgi:hypothetical protein